MLENETYVPGNQVDGSASGGTALYAGRFGRRLELLNRCDSVLGTTLGRIAVSGTTIAFLRCDQTLEVRDLAGTAAPQILGHDVHAVRIAGRYVAWLEGVQYGSERSESDLVVYDRVAGAEAYRIPAAAIPARVASFSLQGDGKVAFAFDTNTQDTNARDVVAWASTSQPSVHTLPLRRRFTYTVVLRRDRIVFSGHDYVGRTYRERVGVTDLKGHSRLIVEKGSGLGIDYDGTHIAYTIHACKTLRGRTPTAYGAQPPSAAALLSSLAPSRPSPNGPDPRPQRLAARGSLLAPLQQIRRFHSQHCTMPLRPQPARAFRVLPK